MTKSKTSYIIYPNIAGTFGFYRGLRMSYRPLKAINAMLAMKAMINRDQDSAYIEWGVSQAAGRTTPVFARNPKIAPVKIFQPLKYDGQFYNGRK